MKKQIILKYSFLIISVLIISCSKDNYKTPNAGIEGKIIDINTNETLQTEQPNGIKIRLMELSYGDKMTPIDFWCKPDGTYENSNIFANKYAVVPIEGAFFPADTTLVDISGNTSLDFKVTPFLNINATAVLGTNSVITNYTISRAQVGGKITTCETLVSYTPSVSNTINEYSVKHSLSSVQDNTILSSQYKDTITGLTSGNIYYVRVGALATNANNKFNYSKIFTIKIP